MQPAELRYRDDPTDGGRLDIAPYRRVTAERHVGAVGVVVRDVLAQDSTQMVLAEHDQVVDNLATRGAHPSLGEPVLPWRPRRDSVLP
jgi:hypothetical protein